jgi:hypothetical protein
MYIYIYKYVYIGRLSVLLSMAGDKGDGIMLKLDFPMVVGKFSGCGDLFTAVFGGILIFRDLLHSGLVVNALFFKNFLFIVYFRSFLQVYES